jgi:uncharacterized peroxidase-related enzyme
MRASVEAMARDQERRERSSEEPIVGGLPDAPGIIAAMQLSAGLAVHLRGIADELLVKEFPGATLTRAERELLATAVSAANDCVYCMDSHGAFAGELLERVTGQRQDALVDAVKTGDVGNLDAKMAALLHIARTVQKRSRDLKRDDVERAKSAGAVDADVQLAVLIAAAFSMYNRMVDGLRAKTPPSVEAFRERARQIADHGYSSPKLNAIPGATPR